MTTTPRAGQEFSFDAVLENWAEGMDYCAIPVPADITEELGTKGPVPVVAASQWFRTVPDQPVSCRWGSALHPDQGQGAQGSDHPAGDRIKVQVTVLERGNVEVPDDLLAALRAEGVLQAFEALPPGKRSFLVRRIDEAARAETRARRVQEGVEAARERREKLKPVR